MAQERTFIKIDLSDYDNRKDEITRDLMIACTEQGFFYGICSFLHHHLNLLPCF
jgi:isopenicillin N synthase-like dioxygenase